MRTRAALLLLLVGCFPDADKLRTKGAGPGPGPQAGSGGNISIGGNAGATGGAGGLGGVVGTGGGMAGSGGSGGSGGGAGGTGGMTSANHAQLCNELAVASAAKANACAPFLQAFRYGSQAAQATRIRVNCNLYDLPGVLFPPAPFQPCAEALAAQPCSEWLDGTTPTACLGRGARATGATCASGYQCASDLCDIPATGCGKCATLPNAGQPCYRGFCAAGAACNPLGSCVTPGRAGAACSANAPCAESLGCHGGVCAALGAPGADCASNDECDIYHGSICGLNNTKCVAVTVGGSCTVNPDGSYVFCGGGATCSMGTCMPPAADGAACSTADQGPACVWPAECLSDMKCHLFQPNPACIGTAAVRPTEPGGGLMPSQGGVEVFWRSLVPRRPLENF